MSNYQFFGWHLLPKDRGRQPSHFKIQIFKIFENFGKFWKSLTCEEQLRWVGPEKGVIHMATAAIINGLWDLWARLGRFENFKNFKKK